MDARCLKVSKWKVNLLESLVSMWAKPNVIRQAGKTISESLMKWRHAREQQLRWPFDTKSLIQTLENSRFTAS